VLAEDTGAPLRRPWLGAPIDVAWEHISPEYASREAQYRDLVRDMVASIPAGIRTAFEAPFIEAITGKRVALTFYLEPTSTSGASETPFLYHQNNRLAGIGGWGGLYGWGAGMGAAASAYVYTLSTSFAALVHEYGHHVDRHYRTLGSKGAGLTTHLSNSPTFAALWNAARPSIPTALYGAKDSGEWFAELFALQLRPTYLNGAQTFLQLAGNDTTRARAIRAAFVSHLPMTPGFAYD
jgi:hypothetical protein